MVKWVQTKMIKRCEVWIMQGERWRIQGVDIDESLTSIGFELLVLWMGIHFSFLLDLTSIKWEVNWCLFWIFTFVFSIFNHLWHKSYVVNSYASKVLWDQLYELCSSISISSEPNPRIKKSYLGSSLIIDISICHHQKIRGINYINYVPPFDLFYTKSSY